MNDERNGLIPMGVQSRETMAMAEAMSPAGVLARQREFEAALAPLSGERDEPSEPRSSVGGKAGAAATRALRRTEATMRSAARGARRQATTAVAGHVRADPLRAVMIAAALGALFAGVLASMARSGARAVGRNLPR